MIFGATMYIASTAKNEPALPTLLMGMLKAVEKPFKAVPRGLFSRSSSEVVGSTDAPAASPCSALGTVPSSCERPLVPVDVPAA